MKFLPHIVFLLFAGSMVAQTTYYSRNATLGGNWNAATSWTIASDGSGPASAVPGRADNVVILAGHTITVNNTNDNGSAGVSANGLGRNLVGAFTNSAAANFYQTGDITVNGSGTLVSNTRLMLEGATLINGSLSSTGDVINLGQMTVYASATFSCDDDLILTGTSRTQLDNTTLSSDDIYIDHTYARLCGSGTMNIGVSSSNTPTVTYFNGASVSQICSGFQITCGPDPACSGFPVNGTGAFTFDITGFNYYKFITINSSQVPGDLANFPVLISISSPDIRTTTDGGGVENANGYDIVFASSQYCTELNLLDYEIESYSSNVTTGTIVAWVNVPAVSSSVNTDIYMYYGNAAQGTDLSTPAVYDNNYTNVYHLNSDFNDATEYGNNGTNGGSSNLTTSKITAGQTFGAGDYIQIPIGDMSTAAGTYSTWCNASSFSTNHQYIAGHTSSTTAWVDRLQLYSDDIGGNLDLGLGNTHSRATNIVNFNTSQWYYVVLTWDGSNYEVFVDGTSQASGTYAAFGSLNTFMDIGNDGRANARNEAWIGGIDETRISTIVRSDDWIQTSFNNQNNPGTFFTAGAELSNTCIPLPIELLNFKAIEQNNSVLLEWTTLSEINNDYFTIERSENLLNWEEVADVDGSGNSRERRYYQLIDDNPYQGTSYYRLSQTDYDGVHKIEGLAAVNFSEAYEVKIYPNPSKGRFLIKSGGNASPKSLQIHDLLGRPVDFHSEREGTNLTITTHNLPKGTYLLSYLLQDIRYTEMIVIN